MKNPRAARLAPVLVLVAIAGYLLGGCGGGDLGGLTSLSGATDLPVGSRPIVTGTRPDLTVPTLPPRTETETETTESTTTEPEPETTTEETATEAEPPPTTEETTTESEPATTTEETTTTEPVSTRAETGTTETIAAEPTSSTDDTPWGWIALGLGIVVAGAVAGIVAWRRRSNDATP
jgi:hypothetical protein